MSKTQLTDEELSIWQANAGLHDRKKTVPIVAQVPHDPVNHPSHYRIRMGDGTEVECLDLIEALGASYHVGNVLKYLFRADSKGKRLEDLRKARFYLDRYISLLQDCE